MSFPEALKKRTLTAIESQLIQQVVALEKERDELVEALRELFDARRTYDTLRGTSYGGVVHDARDRFSDADSWAECLLAKYPL